MTSPNEHSRSSPALDKNIKLNSFTDDAIDERTESKATKSKFKTEVKENYLLTNFLQTNCLFFCNHCSYEAKRHF